MTRITNERAEESTGTWVRLPDQKVNCGAGGDETCHLYRHSVSGRYKCVTTDRNGEFTHITYHDDWD